MKYYLGLGGLCLGAAVVLAAPASTLATPTEVTGIELRETPSGLMLMMQTAGGDRPQIFLVRRGNSMVADLINTKLRLPQGQGYSQNNPVPGIASLVVTPLDANSTRVIVTGAGDSAPEGEIVQEATQGIALNYRRAADAPTTAASPPPGITGAPQGQSQGQSNVAQQQRPQQQQAQRQGSSDVLVPNPGVEIDGVRIDAPTRVNPAPPFQPRAVAPPVGDISVSSVDTSSYSISLGTAQRVPRLVLRDAPVEEVLSLLARAAGLNLAYVASNGDNGDNGNGRRTISLDIENEAVQDVFNNVLRLSGLEANREGNTIVVGERLPDSARPIISRTVRLNQLTLIDARNFLVSQGAEINEVSVQQQIQAQSIGEGTAPITTTSTTTQVELIAADRRDQPYQGHAALPLRGVLVSIGQRQQTGDGPGTELTLVGDPRKVEMATQLLTQLETRRRQVAVNVKIVDISLSNQDNFNASFSFGVGDTFVSSDGGAATVIFGGGNPPSSATTRDGFASPPVIQNPFGGTETFVDLSRTTRIPGAGEPGQLIIEEDPTTGQITTRREAPPPGGDLFFDREAAISQENPFNVGITDLELAEDTVITLEPVFDDDGNFTGRFNPNVQEGQRGSATASVADLFQFPTRFLAQLQAQVVSGNAKILTDPTLVIQEGQTANVNLTNQVVQDVTVDFTDTPSGQRETRDVNLRDVGLQLSVQVDRIDDNGFVSLRVNPSVTAPVGQENLGNGQFVTLVQERSVSSGRVRLRDGQTLILSGIIQDTDRTTVTKVPILGDIPLLGSLFRSTSRTNERQEVVVLLTPNILNDSDPNNFGYTYTPGRDAREVLQQQRNFTFPQPQQ
ncbi:type IV pilus secretin family protein [Geitlerinema sp. P-1104]|uniref:AMIN domain-containing protein n=1 Tax=Geitlerinema sp. P-1104 TaxID=2546230 RepID=UPI0014773777|nr:type IV pilus secretin family protein [Geitlerinema sp. P-1104]